MLLPGETQAQGTHEAAGVLVHAVDRHCLGQRRRDVGGGGEVREPLAQVDHGGVGGQAGEGHPETHSQGVAGSVSGGRSLTWLLMYPLIVCFTSWF